MSKAAVQQFVRGYSIETTVPQAARVGRFADAVPPGTRLFIAHVPGTDVAETVTLAGRLRREGMEPVPHVVARRFRDMAMLDAFLARLAGEAGVTQALVVAGDNATPEGALTSGLEVLEAGLLERHGIRTIGVAGHPEGHREVPDAVLREALRRKNAYAARTGADVRIVTQFTFSADPVIAWLGSHAPDIGRLTVTAGLPGLATARTLLKYAMDCGVGPSIQAFSTRYASLTKLLTVSAPDDIVVALARHAGQDPGSPLAGVHFFPFGGFAKTAAWANKVAAGEFEITDNGGLRVD
jgi:methylenetetrahydrofolate reductase (NADPH)